jgi:hypothetical protein
MRDNPSPQPSRLCFGRNKSAGTTIGVFLHPAEWLQTDGLSVFGRDCSRLSRTAPLAIKKKREPHGAGFTETSPLIPWIRIFALVVVVVVILHRINMETARDPEKTWPVSETSRPCMDDGRVETSPGTLMLSNGLYCSPMIGCSPNRN